MWWGVSNEHSLHLRRKNWKLSRDNSKFVDWQRVRVQENADEVPAGSLPRSMDVILRHETVRSRAAVADRQLPAKTLTAPRLPHL